MANTVNPTTNPTNPSLKHPTPSIKPPPGRFTSTKPPPSRFTSTKPRPKRRRGVCRTLFSGCCCFILWLIVSIFFLLLLAAGACGLFYVLYKPQLPLVYVSSISASYFNITTPNKLDSRFNFTVTAKNSNQNIQLFFSQVEAHCYTNNVEIGSGSFPAFMLEPGKFATMTTVLGSNSIGLEPMAAARLKNKWKLPVSVQLDTEAGVKVGKVKFF